MSFKEIISLGSLTTLLGIGVTFIMLLVLVGVLNTLARFSSIGKKNTRKTADKVEVADSNLVIENKLIDNNNSEIAAILAAVYAELEQEDLPQVGFKVKSIKRIG